MVLCHLNLDLKTYHFIQFFFFFNNLCLDAKSPMNIFLVFSEVR